MRGITRTTLVGALVLGAGGCGTVHDVTRDARPFGGVQADLEAIESAGCKAAVVIPLAILDMPLSAAADVVVLPATTLHEITR